MSKNRWIDDLQHENSRILIENMTKLLQKNEHGYWALYSQQPAKTLDFTEEYWEISSSIKKKLYLENNEQEDDYQLMDLLEYS